MVQWGHITEREGLEELISIITRISESRAGGEVSPNDVQEPLRDIVRARNPEMNLDEADSVASSIRGWLGSRYTQLDAVSHYVNMESLVRFVNNFQRSGNPYRYSRREAER